MPFTVILRTKLEGIRILKKISCNVTLEVTLANSCPYNKTIDLSL